MDARLLCLKRPHCTDTSSTEPWKIINRELGGLAVSDVHVTTVQRSASNDDPAQRTARDHIVDCVTRELGSDCGAFSKIDDWTDWEVHDIGGIYNTDPVDIDMDRVMVIIFRKQMPSPGS